ncbi:MAG: hypothetical protein V1892_00555 [bacterium]
MENKKYQDFLKNYYDKKKRLIDITGFVGIITGLFLQITQFQNDSLRMVQVLLLILFTALLSYLIINFWIKLISYKEETPKSIALNSTLLSLSVGLFIFNLFAFIHTSFKNQLDFIFHWSKFGILLLLSLYFFDGMKFLSSKFGREKLWLVTNEIFFAILYYFFFIYKKEYFDKKLIIIPALLVLLNIPLAFKWISRKIFYWLIALMVIIYILLKIW